MRGVSKLQSFRDLQIWQRSMEMTQLIYHLTRRFPREELYGITSQLRRASVSVPANIAEGQGRLNKREFIQFLGIAKGSTCEVQTLLELSHRLGLGNPEEIRKAHSLSQEVGKMLFSFITALKSSA